MTHFKRWATTAGVALLLLGVWHRAAAEQIWSGWFIGDCPASPRLRECSAGRPCRTDFAQTYPGLCGMRGDDAQEFGGRRMVATTLRGAIRYARTHDLDVVVIDNENVQLTPSWFAGE